MKDNNALVEFIESLGFVDVEDNGDNISFEGEYQMSIEVSEISLTDTGADIFRKADNYSCCGDVLDEDYMICPSCKEHC